LICKIELNNIQYHAIMGYVEYLHYMLLLMIHIEIMLWE